MADILVVDDTPESLRVLLQILQDQGYQVRPATNGKRALASARKAPPDLILLDICMPDMDGYEVCRRLKADPHTADIPVLFLSSMDELAEKVRAFEEGGLDYVTKPFREAEVLARIECQLTIQRQRRELAESRDLLSSVLNSSLDGVIVWESVRQRGGDPPHAPPEGKLTDLRATLTNPSARELTGSEVVGQTLGALFPALLEDALQVVESGHPVDRELHVESRWLQAIAVKLGDGLALTLRDTTQRKQLELHLARQANLDGLTEVANRRAFEVCLEREWKRCARNRLPLSIVMGDIDFFKQYNDTYGHLAGDECLIAVAQAVSRAVKRPSDLVARYGGEEFVCILPDTDCDGALSVAAAISEEVRQLQRPHSASPAGRVTMSLGVTSAIPEFHEPAEALLEQADRALYQAKHNGRNRIHAVTLTSA